MPDASDGSQRNPLPLDRLQHRPRGDDRIGTQIPTLSEQAEFYRSPASGRPVRGLPSPSLCGRYREQWECVLQTISELTVGNRPNRKEPRQIKRRPKPYKLLQSARKSIKTREATTS
ncbi:hypothetical protein C5Y97_24670 [Blastopirellula marina]|uniref:Uncharacterized protein n=1 Tax=Blastopirellula marina TaxID=124 RepID=A0A2S8F9V7_9BACT|nr:hypothetical protein C5Y98_24655 [Blastopirellula marina]PTL42226.1 hypothetical protein C5Y97_24670 [Blastopirellula marina]